VHLSGEGKRACNELQRCAWEFADVDRSCDDDVSDEGETERWPSGIALSDQVVEVSSGYRVQLLIGVGAERGELVLRCGSGDILAGSAVEPVAAAVVDDGRKSDDTFVGMRTTLRSSSRENVTPGRRRASTRSIGSKAAKLRDRATPQHPSYNYRARPGLTMRARSAHLDPSVPEGINGSQGNRGPSRR